MPYLKNNADGHLELLLSKSDLSCKLMNVKKIEYPSELKVVKPAVYVVLSIKSMVISKQNFVKIEKKKTPIYFR